MPEAQPESMVSILVDRCCSAHQQTEIFSSTHSDGLWEIKKISSVLTSASAGIMETYLLR